MTRPSFAPPPPQRSKAKAIAALAALWFVGSWIFRSSDTARHPSTGASPRHTEGYWPDVELCLPLGSARPPWHRRRSTNADCPQWRINPSWSGRDEFVTKLRDIESTAKEYEERLVGVTPDFVERHYEGMDGIRPPVFVRRERGVAWSRIDEGIIAGNSEYHAVVQRGDGTPDGTVVWTDALLPHYVEEHGVEPTEEFKAFISTFDLGAFRRKLEGLKVNLQNER